jgi:TetR/AcrR family transcriptional regulator, transcriptional repressor of bet genes
MGPIRREQICRAAATVISREGFAGTTMRMVAEEAGVSTGMLNHYFANRQDLLQQALVFVSERAQARMRAAIEDVPPGRARLEALLDSALAEGQEVSETWRVWINAYGEAVRLADLRHTIESRLNSWYELLDKALEGLVPPEQNGMIPWSWRLAARRAAGRGCEGGRGQEGPDGLSGRPAARMDSARGAQRAHALRRALRTRVLAGTVYPPMLRNIERREPEREQRSETAQGERGHASRG